MCKTTLFKHKTCKHTWGVISEPCGPGMGFSTCDTLYGGLHEGPPALYNTKSRPCPRCERELHRVQYDPNTVRMVESTGWGFKWGTGPGRDDWGWEMKFRDGCVIL